MVFIRPATLDDLDPLIELASSAGVGLTTLPRDRDLLERRIAKSVRSFESIPQRPGGESYLFVMVDAESKKVIGASGIVSKVGGFEPFYGFEIRTERHSSEALNVHTDVPYLQLVTQHDGPCEIGSLFLHPDYRRRENGRLLQLVRFIFAAEHLRAFETTVVSELRGVIDPSGFSPFWDAVGRHFFDIDFPQADHLSVVNKKFIADLMPRHPIYIPLLSPGAREVIGVSHEESKPAMRNLEAEGFRFSGMVDIFDAGPCISCPLDEVRTVRDSRVARVGPFADEVIDAPSYIVATRGAAFRAAAGPAEVSHGTLRIGRAIAEMIGIREGDDVRVVPLRPASADGSPLDEHAATEGSD